MDENKGIPSALVSVPAKEQQEYVVQMAFELPDVEKESKLTVHFDDTQGYSFHIYASSIMEAIDRAWQVLMVMKAELITGYPAILEEIDDDDVVDMSKDTLTLIMHEIDGLQLTPEDGSKLKGIIKDLYMESLSL